MPQQMQGVPDLENHWRLVGAACFFVLADRPSFLLPLVLFESMTFCSKAITGSERKDFDFKEVTRSADLARIKSHAVSPFETHLDSDSNNQNADPKLAAWPLSAHGRDRISHGIRSHQRPLELKRRCFEMFSNQNQSHMIINQY